MAIAITFLERYEPSARNTVVLFDRHGKKAFTYAKVHTCDFDVERNLTPGEDFYVAQLDTAAGQVKGRQPEFVMTGNFPKAHGF